MVKSCGDFKTSRLQDFKYESITCGEQERDMRSFAGLCRFVYSKAMAIQIESHEAGNKFIGYVSMAANLPIWKRKSRPQ
ncbi:MAG: helix-turn-helix domain-containing protein [Candidatus Binatia bacterium]